MIKKIILLSSVALVSAAPVEASEGCSLSPPEEDFFRKASQRQEKQDQKDKRRLEKKAKKLNVSPHLLTLINEEKEKGGALFSNIASMVTEDGKKQRTRSKSEPVKALLKSLKSLSSSAQTSTPKGESVITQEKEASTSQKPPRPPRRKSEPSKVRFKKRELPTPPTRTSVKDESGKGAPKRPPRAKDESGKETPPRPPRPRRQSEPAKVQPEVSTSNTRPPRPPRSGLESQSVK